MRHEEPASDKRLAARRDGVSMTAGTEPPYLMDLRNPLTQGLFNRGLIMDPSLRQWHRLRNAFAGQSGFVIGNGPSLSVADLERIAGLPSIGSNKLYLAYPETSFRPTLLTCIDPIVTANIVEELRALPGRKYFSHRLAPIVEPMPGAVYWNDQTGHTDDPELKRKFSLDARRVLYAGHTVTFNNLQIAFHLGLSTVYLIGVDFRFQLPKDSVQHDYNKAYVSSGEVNHFHPDYRKPGEIWSVPQLEHQKRAFESARLHFERHGRRIFNASRATDLDVFDRVDFDEVMRAWN